MKHRQILNGPISFVATQRWILWNNLCRVQAEVEHSAEALEAFEAVDDLLGVRECLYLQARLLSSATPERQERDRKSERCLLVMEELQRNRHYQPSSTAASTICAELEDLAAFKDCFQASKYC